MPYWRECRISVWGTVVTSRSLPKMRMDPGNKWLSGPTFHTWSLHHPREISEVNPNLSWLQQEHCPFSSSLQWQLWAGSHWCIFYLQKKWWTKWSHLGPLTGCLCYYRDLASWWWMRQPCPSWTSSVWLQDSYPMVPVVAELNSLCGKA